MTIHHEHPFADPPGSRRELRRVRGRWAGGVSVWTSPAGTVASRHQPVGLTVSSMVLADGEPGEVVGLLDPESDLAEALEVVPRAMINILAIDGEELAEVFAGRAPAPGGPFTVGEWSQTPYGPRLASAIVAMAVDVVDLTADVGWSVLVRGRIAEIEWGPDAAPLVHLRGRYGSVGPVGS